jgi:hypothetical protein
MTAPPRPTGSSAKARFWQWAFDSLQELTPRGGPGVLVDRTTRGVFVRMLQQRSARREDFTFACTWNFLRSSSPVATVENGLCFNSTAEEQELVSRPVITNELAIAALKMDSSVQFLPTYPDHATTVISRTYPANVRRLRIQLSAPNYADTIPVIPGDTSGRDAGPHLFLNLIEIPPMLQSVDLVYYPDLSEDGFHYYTSPGSGFSILKSDSRFIGAVQNTLFPSLSGDAACRNVIKPRPEMHGEWIVINGGAGIAFTEQVSSPLYYLPTQENWSETRNSTNRTFLTASDSGAVIDTTGVETYVVFTSAPPLDGDTLTVAGEVKTWRTTVSNPATEIECLAYDPEDETEAQDARVFAITSLQQTLGAHPFAAAVFHGDHFTRQTAPFSIAKTGAWCTLRTHGKQFDWRPTPSAENKVCTNAGIRSDPTPGRPDFIGGDSQTVNRPDWMAIPLTEAFDQEVELPAFSNRFIVQAFFGPYLTLQRNKNLIPIDPPRDFQFTLTVTQP